MLHDTRSNLPSLRFGCAFRAWLILFAGFGGLSAKPLFASTLPTTITLTVSPSTVEAQKPVTLTATVMADGTPARPGQVVFCVATATFCEDLNLLGTAQVTSNGTATIKVLLPLGKRQIYAKFLGTTKYAGSTSLPSVKTVEVNGHQPSIATVSTSGGPRSYTLASTVAALGTIPLTGTVSFNDYSTFKTVASASVDSTIRSFGFTPSTVYHGNSKAYQSGVFGEATVADVNNDGYPDVIAGNPPGSISVQFGDPAHPGELLTATNLPAGQGPVAVASADFNQDGVPDIVVMNQGEASVGVLFGDPTHPGRFLPQQKSSVGDVPFSLAVGDLNGDGLPDIVVASFNGPNSASVLFNNPAAPGQFLPMVGFAPQMFGGSTVAVGDFNADGLLDLAVGNFNVGGGIMVLLNNPAAPGQFFPPISYGTGAPDAVVVGDFNRDGIPDLAVGSFNDGNELDVLLGDPAHPGKFLPSTALTKDIFGAGEFLASGDFNGDGILDLVTADPYSANHNNMAIFFGDQAHPGQFLPKADYADHELGITASGYPIAGDLNGDGLSDLIVPGEDELSILPEVSLFLGSLRYTAAASPIDLTNSSYVHATYSGDEHYLSNDSCDISFPAPAKLSAPVISGVYLSNVTATSATVNWTTNVPAYGGVDWSTVTGNEATDGFNHRTAWVDQFSTTHAFVIKSFYPGYQYTFKAWSLSYFSGCDHWTSFSPQGYVPVVAAN